MYLINTIYSIDASEETGRLGRLINHSKKNPNVKTTVIEFNKQPHLVFIAIKDIAAGEEILYDYGERKQEIIEGHKWLKM